MPAHNGRLQDGWRRTVKSPTAESGMAIFLILLGCSLFSMGVGLWIGYLRAESGVLRGSFASRYRSCIL